MANVKRLTLQVENASISRVASRHRGGESPRAYVVLTVEVPEEALEDAEIGRLHQYTGRDVRLQIASIQTEMPLDTER
jgi:hypothetical protein